MRRLYPLPCHGTSHSSRSKAPPDAPQRAAEDFRSRPSSPHHKPLEYNSPSAAPSWRSGGTLDKPWTCSGTIEPPPTPVFDQPHLSNSLHPIPWAAHPQPGLAHHVRIDLGRRHVLVPKQFLHRADERFFPLLQLRRPGRPLQALQLDVLPRQGHRRLRCAAAPAATSPAGSALEAELLEACQRPPVALPQTRGEPRIVRQPAPPIGGLATPRPAAYLVPSEYARKA